MLGFLNCNFNNLIYLYPEFRICSCDSRPTLSDFVVLFFQVNVSTGKAVTVYSNQFNHRIAPLVSTPRCINMPRLSLMVLELIPVEIRKLAKSGNAAPSTLKRYDCRNLNLTMSMSLNFYQSYFMGFSSAHR